MKILSCFLLLITWSTVSGQSFLRCKDNRSDCCDRHRFCSFWAGTGECNKNPTWMPRNCQMSCNTDNCARPTSRDQPIPDDNGQCKNVIPVEIDSRGGIDTPLNLLTRWIRTTRCAEPTVPNDCSFAACFHTKYRTMDGTCNNLRTSNVGAAFTPYARLLPADYADGFNALNGNRRPSARHIVTQLLRSSKSIPLQWNSMLMQWGQFISHDMTKNTMANGPLTCAGACPAECANIITPTDREQHTCIPYVRSLRVCNTGIPNRPREQLNSNTAFIDGSQIYSSESVSIRSLRSPNQAFLMGSIQMGASFPPGVFTVGDDRGNIFFGLSAIHIVFFRLHNIIAADLQNKNPQWNGDRTFHETRKLVGAIVQHITYTEFLPKLLGSFNQQLMNPYRGYNISVNPAILNEFAGSAYRLHGLIQDSFSLLDERYQNAGSIQFASGLQQPNIAKTQMSRVLRGFMSHPSKSPQRYSDSASSSFNLASLNIQIFEMNEARKMSAGTVLEKVICADHTAVLLLNPTMTNIKLDRGRDHGLRSYNDYRKLCNLQPMTFDNWPEVADSAVRERVRQLYNNDHNAIDLTVGGMAEEPRDGDALGPTFACIISEQFSRLRDGDRFYYENTGIFTPEQIAAIKKTSLAWAFCQTEDRLGRSNRDAFAIERGFNAVPCSAIQGLDTSAWQE